jgi:hypothetical protein
MFDDKIVANNRSVLPHLIKSIPVQPIISQPIPTQSVITQPTQPVKLDPLIVISSISNKEPHDQQEEIKVIDPKTTIEEKIVVEKPYIPIPKIETPKDISTELVLNFPQQSLTQIPDPYVQDIPQDITPKEYSVLPWVIGIGALGLLFFMRTRNTKLTTSEPNYNINNVSI